MHEQIARFCCLASRHLALPACMLHRSPALHCTALLAPAQPQGLCCCARPSRSNPTREVRVTMESTWTVVACRGSACSGCTSASSLRQQQQVKHGPCQAPSPAGPSSGCHWRSHRTPKPWADNCLAVSPGGVKLQGGQRWGSATGWLALHEVHRMPHKQLPKLLQQWGSLQASRGRAR